MQDTITRWALCLAIGAALSAVVAAGLSRPGRNPMIGSILFRLAIAAGPVYLAADYALYQGTAVAAGMAGMFALGLYALRGWWVPGPLAGARRAAAVEQRAAPANPAASGGILHLAGRRRGATEGTALRVRVLSVVHADRQGERPQDRSMPSAA